MAYSQRSYGYEPYNSYGSSRSRGSSSRSFASRSNSYRKSNAVKHSGSQFGQDKNGRLCINGWRYSKRYGLMKFIAGPTDKTKEVTSKNGKTWLNLCAWITFGDGRRQAVSCMYDRDAKRLYFSDMGLIATRGGAGGYWGKGGCKMTVR